MAGGHAAQRPTITQIAGVTPCPAGWLVLPARLNGITIVADDPVVIPTLAGVLDYKPAFDSAAVEVPIGLFDEPSAPYRDCDAAARDLIGWPRAAALFSVPSRAALRAPTFEAARLLEPWISEGDWRRFRWIRQAEAEIQPFHQRRWFSANSDLSYVSLNGDEPLASSPHLDEGVAERRALLQQRMPGVDDVLDRIPPAGATRVHLVRAAGLLWTARRAQGRVATRLPVDSDWDSAGLRMELVR
jgi:predicted RNase H-like nuclease